MTGSAPSVAILKQFTCGSEAALAAASCSRLGDATMSCRRPATTAPRGARARPNAAARASISGLGSREQPLIPMDMTHLKCSPLRLPPPGPSRRKIISQIREGLRTV